MRRSVPILFGLALAACKNDGVREGGVRASAPPPEASAPSPSASASAPANVPAPSSSSSSSSSSSVAPLGPRFVGYFDRSDPKGPHFSWPGTRIELRFRGTSAKVRLLDGSGGHVHFTVAVDGVTSRLDLRPGDATYTLARELPSGEHTISLFRDTEALWGETQLLGFDVDGPWLPVPTPERRLLFIGDSITCGYGIEGKGPSCGFLASEENAYRGWAAVASRELGADAEILAFSGGGIVRNNEGDRVDTMPARILRTIPTRKTSPAPDAEPSPQVIVINLLTNDFALGAPPKAEIVGAFGALLDDLHRRFPPAAFVLALGPMLYGKALDAARAALVDVTSAAKARGLDAELLELPMQDGHDGFGCQHHPNVARQQSMASDLVTHLRRRLKW